MTTSIRSEATRSVVEVNGVDVLSVKPDGAMELLTTTGMTGTHVPMMRQVATKTLTGTSVDFSPATNDGVPSWAKKITVSVNGASTNGASIVQLQLGTSSGIEATGYACLVDTTFSSGSSPADITTGLALDRAGASTAASSRNGIAEFVQQSNNTWVMKYVGRAGSSIGMSLAAGGKTLTGVLDRIRITTVNGTDTFDAGSVSVIYEG